MEIRVLGAHKTESRETRHTCFLIDQVLGVDAGSLASALTVQEQGRVQAVAVTHQHFDHIRDLPTLALATIDDPKTIDLYSLSQTGQALKGHLLNWDLYPDFTESLEGGPPKFRLNPVEADLEFAALGFQLRGLEVLHTVPTIGYLIRAADGGGGCVAYTGDTSGNLMPFFQDPWAPQVVFLEVSFPDRLAHVALRSGHLTPGSLKAELKQAQEAGLVLPKMVGVHLSPENQQELEDEVGAVAHELGVDLTLGRQDMVFKV